MIVLIFTQNIFMAIKQEIFTSFKLMKGEKCDVLELKFGHICTANFKVAYQKDTEYDMIFFLLQQILLIDDKNPSIEFLENLMTDDYVKISDAVAVLMNKLPKF